MLGQEPAPRKAGVRDLVLPAITREGPIAARIVDDTGFAKKGRHSVGVARQYCGQLGKQSLPPTRSGVAVSLSLANHAASLPIADRLYLPEAWAADPVRRARAGVPDAIVFRTKPEIALDRTRAAVAAGVPQGVVLMDTPSWQRHRLAQRRERAGADRCGRDAAAHPGLDPR